MKCYHLRKIVIFLLALTVVNIGRAEDREKFIPDDVDFAHPVYTADFDSKASLDQWVMEGGGTAEIAHGGLLLKNGGGPDGLEKNDHLVYWLKKEAPADFLLEFTFRPRNREEGLAIVFFNARGRNGQSIFDPALARRTADFRQYHSGDLDCYHVSYWSGATRAKDKKDPSVPPSANVRKNHGFHLVASGADLVVENGRGDAFQTVRIYKRGGEIRVTVDDVLAVAYDDDGGQFDPVLSQPGWIGLRQMKHTGFAEYGRLAVYPLKAAAAPK